MSVQPQLVLLQKTLLNIEGLGRELYPELNLWATAKPFLEKWMKTRVGWKGFVKRSMDNIPDLSERLPDVPEMLFDLLSSKAKKARFEDNNQMNQPKTPKQSKKRGVLLGLGLSLTVLGIIYGYNNELLNDLHRFLAKHYGIVGSVGVVLLVYMLISKQKD